MSVQNVVAKLERKEKIELVQTEVVSHAKDDKIAAKQGNENDLGHERGGESEEKSDIEIRVEHRDGEKSSRLDRVNENRQGELDQRIRVVYGVGKVNRKLNL